MPTVTVKGPAGGTYEVQVHGATLLHRALQGAGLSVAMTLLRVLSGIVNRQGIPLLGWLALLGAVTIGGGVGGGAYYMSDAWRVRGGWRKTAANVGTLLIYGAGCLGALLVAGLVVPGLWQ